MYRKEPPNNNNNKKKKKKKKDEAYMRAHKMVEDLKMGRMDVSGGEL